GQPRDQLVQLLVTARRGQRRAPHVISDVEVVVVQPHRPGRANLHLPHLLAVARYLWQPLLDGGQQGLVAQAGAGATQDRQRSDVHGGRGVLQPIKRRVRRRQASHHAALSSWSVRRPCARGPWTLGPDVPPTVIVWPCTGQRGYAGG